MSQADSLEWCIFRQLGSLLSGRLTKHCPTSRGKRKNAKFDMRCALFEVSLRETLTMNLELPPPVTNQNNFLKSALRLLNSLVNEQFLVNSEKNLTYLPESTSSMDKYEKLHSLIRQLEMDSDLNSHLQGTEISSHEINTCRSARMFDLARSTQNYPPIFLLDCPDIAKEALKTISNFHDSLLQIQASSGIPRKRARSPDRKSDELSTVFKDRGIDIQFRRQASIVFDALHRYLSCKTHKIMLRPQKRLYGELDLFLSGCQDTELWQEVRCLCYMSGGPICQVDNICETLAKFTDQRMQLIVDVDVNPNKIHCSTLTTSQTSPEATFSEPLDKLIQKELLREINFENVSANVFSRKDKYALAYTLGLCFLNFFDAGFMAQSWNSASIVFLVPKSHKTQDGYLYIRCSPQKPPSTAGGESVPCQSAVLTSFAALLLEIYCGQPLPSKVQELEGLHFWAELCYLVRVLEGHDRNSYLEAVSGCLHLDRQLSALSEDGSVDVRELVHKQIVRHLQSGLEGLTRKRITLEHKALRIHGKLQNDEIHDMPNYASRNLPPKEPRHKFTIAIVCALPLEADAAQALFDEYYDEGNQAYAKMVGDENVYTTGRIGNHNIVLCHLPEMGTSSAASVATGLRISYPDIELTLVVGICGGVPFPSDDEELEIHLGDVIISDSVLKYDFGHQLPDKFVPKSGGETLGYTGRRIQGLLRKLKTTQAKIKFQEQTLRNLQKLQSRQTEGAHGPRNRYSHPGFEHDKLYPASYNHMPYQQESLLYCTCSCCQAGHNPSCDAIRKKDCDTLGCTAPLVPRDRHSQGNTQPFIHIGRIACADTVMKSGAHRDELARKEKVIGFEMEGVGVWSHGRQCLIIKGVSDYADSHKNNKWQRYAAAAAASSTKAFLDFWESNP